MEIKGPRKLLNVSQVSNCFKKLSFRNDVKVSAHLMNFFKPQESFRKLQGIPVALCRMILNAFKDTINLRNVLNISVNLKSYAQCSGIFYFTSIDKSHC